MIITMGEVNSNSLSNRQRAEHLALEPDDNEAQQPRDDDNADQDQPGAWSVYRLLSNLNPFRRRRGADLYDDGKSSSYHNQSNEQGHSGHEVINKRFPDGQTLLTRALRFENDQYLMANVKNILQLPGIDVNYPELQQNGLHSYIEVPPIIVATKTKNEDLVELLLESGASVNAQDSNHLTALHYVSESGDLDIVSVLLKYRPRLTSMSVVEDPLHEACRHGYKEVVIQLVEAGADINPEKRSFLTAPLLLAAENKHEDICLYLLDKLSRNKTDLDLKENVFIRACWFGCPRVVQYLIELGSNVNTISMYNSTGLVHALRSGDLARHGRELKVSQGEQRLLVMSRLRKVLEESVTIINLLCANHVDLEQVSGMYQMAPLSLSLKAANIPAAIVLLKHGVWWDDNCDYVYERSNIKRLQNLDPKLHSILLQFLDNKRRSLYKPKKCSNTVRPLKDCCRHVIRSRVRRQMSSQTSTMSSLRYLPLPSILKNYLCYSEIDDMQLVNDFELSFLSS